MNRVGDCVQPMLCRLCGKCVCMLVDNGDIIESDCGKMSGQKSFRGLKLCSLYNLSR